MTECRILSQYKGLSSAHQRTFDLWLRASAIVGSVVGLAVVAMAIGGARVSGSSPEQRALSNPPVGQIENLTFVFSSATVPKRDRVILSLVRHQVESRNTRASLEV